ncbi:MAG: flagellar basal body rod protein FlgB [Desulfobulbaceae bacterium]|nr:flagellar basal body rod protein FlgB [Desulfobulbaceae bacterium]
MSILTQLDGAMNLLHKVLDLRTTNQQVIASNIANADTPGYAPASFQFEKQLRNAVSEVDIRPVTNQPGHFAITPDSINQIKGEITRSPDKTRIGDQNGVKLDQEMINLSENQILYEAAMTMLNKKLALLKYSANDGK